MTRARLRIGLLAGGADLRRFDAVLIERIEAAGTGKVVLVIQEDLPRRSPLRRLLRSLGRGTLLASVAFKAMVWLEQHALRRVRPKIQRLFTTVPIGSVCNAERLIVKPIVSPSGRVHRFAPADIEAIKARKLDLILRANSAILRGDILGAATEGILSFHHGDNRISRGGPAGFWEVVERRDFTGYVVQRLSEELDGGEVLARGELATRQSYLLNQLSLFQCSITSMVDLLARIQRQREGAAPPEAEPVSWYPKLLYREPSALQTLRYLIDFVGRVLVLNLARRLLAWRDVWELRLAPGGWGSLVLSRAMVIAPPRGRFWADPFIRHRDGEVVVFFEEFDYRSGKAHIAALVGEDGNSLRYAGPVIEASHHLSFPYLFRYQGEDYMCPESADACCIELWRCVQWPLKWQPYKTLLSGISAADSMIFEHGGRWWLFTNLDRDGANNHCRELHVFHADSPLSDAWIPHPANPVVTGASQARNAGLLRSEGKIYRLAQSQGFASYGRSIRLFEIERLSASDYSERPVTELSPDPRLGARAIHHLSACEDWVVFDAVRPRLFWFASGAKVAMP